MVTCCSPEGAVNVTASPTYRPLIAAPSGEVGEYTSASRSGSRPLSSRLPNRKVAVDPSRSSRTVTRIPGSTRPSSGLRSISALRRSSRSSRARSTLPLSVLEPARSSSASSASSLCRAVKVIHTDSVAIAAGIPSLKSVRRKVCTPNRPFYLARGGVGAFVLPACA